MTHPPIHFLAVYGTLTPQPIVLANAEELTTYSRWVRGTIREFLHFSGRVLATKIITGRYLTVEIARYPLLAHSYTREDGLVAVAITLREYPTELVHRLLQRAIQRYPDTRWMLDRTDATQTDPEYLALIAQYQDPITADPIKNVQRKIEQVQAVAVTAIDKLLVRGETISELVAKSNDLSISSKKFYQKSEDVNGCCWRWLGWKRHSGDTD